MRLGLTNSFLRALFCAIVAPFLAAAAAYAAVQPDSRQLELPLSDPCTTTLKLEIEADFAKSLTEYSADDKAFVDSMQSKPVDTYSKLRADAIKYLANHPGNDFPFEPHRAILKKIIADLELRLGRRFGAKYSQQINDTIQKARALLNNNAQAPFYKATVRFVMQTYLPVLDNILLERHPELRGKNYHKTHAEPMVEEIMKNAPDSFFYFSFEWVNDEFFVDSRTAPMNMIGINFSGLDDESPPPYADKFALLTSNFAYHDIGHAEFTTEKDLKYLRKSKKRLDRVVWEWEATRVRIKAAVDQVKSQDFNLGDACETLLFEMLRERGFQFSLTVLKQELETPKWVDVLLKKYQLNFYKYYGTNDAKFGRLNEARLLLLKAVERLRVTAQMSWITTADAETTLEKPGVPVKITYSPPLEYHNDGTFQRLEFADVGGDDVKNRVYLSVNTGKTLKTEVRDIVSAQVDPVSHSPLTAQRVAKIEFTLSKKAAHQPIRVQDGTTVRFLQPENVYLDRNRNLYVVLANGDVSKLDNVVITNNFRITRKLTEIELFEANQLLGAAERNELTAFTVHPRDQSYEGKITKLQDLATGDYAIIVHQLNGGPDITLPLTSVRIDTLSIN